MASRDPAYMLAFPHSADEHAFAFNFDSGQWWEYNHFPLNATIPRYGHALPSFLSQNSQPADPPEPLPQDWIQEATDIGYSTGRIYPGFAELGGNLYLAGGRELLPIVYTDDVWKSTDSGASWSQIKTGAAFGKRYGPFLLSFNNKLWALPGQDQTTNYARSDVYSSTDGVTWSLETADWGVNDGGTQWLTNYVSAVLGDRMAVFGGWYKTKSGAQQTTDTTDVWTSTDGINWSKVASDFMGLYDIDFTNGAAAGDGDSTLIYAGNSPTNNDGKQLWISSDKGANWTDRSSSVTWPARAFNGAGFIKGHFHVFGGYWSTDDTTYSDNYRTADGTEWETMEAPDWTIDRARFGYGQSLTSEQIFLAGGVNEDSGVGQKDFWSYQYV